MTGLKAVGRTCGSAPSCTENPFLDVCFCRIRKGNFPNTPTVLAAHHRRSQHHHVTRQRQAALACRRPITGMVCGTGPAITPMKSNRGVIFTSSSACEREADDSGQCYSLFCRQFLLTYCTAVRCAFKDINGFGSFLLWTVIHLQIINKHVH